MAAVTGTVRPSLQWLTGAALVAGVVAIVGAFGPWYGVDRVGDEGGRTIAGTSEGLWCLISIGAGLLVMIGAALMGSARHPARTTFLLVPSLAGLAAGDMALNHAVASTGGGVPAGGSIGWGIWLVVGGLGASLLIGIAALVLDQIAVWHAPAGA